MDTSVEGRGRGLWLHTQLLLQDTAAAFVLGQRRAALAVGCQQAHGLPMRWLVPGIKLQQAGGRAAGRLERAVALVVIGQAGQRSPRHLAQPLAPQQHPLLERRAAGQREAGQEIALIEGHSLLRVLDAGCAAFAVAVPMLLANGQVLGEGRHVQGVAAGGVELDAVAGDVQKGWGNSAIAEDLAQAGQGLAQVAARGLFGQVRPEQADQGLPRVLPVALDRQESQQRPRLGVGEAVDRLSIQRQVKGSQQGQCQVRHVALV